MPLSQSSGGEYRGSFGSVDRRKALHLQGNSSLVALMVATDKAESGCTQLITFAVTDSELTRLIEAWPHLTATTRRIILASIEVDRGSDQGQQWVEKFGHRRIV